MTRDTRLVVVSVVSCCVLTAVVVALVFLSYPRAGMAMLSRHALVVVVALAAAALVGYLLARYALVAGLRDTVEREAKLRRYLAETGHELRTPLAVMSASLDALRGAAQPRDATTQTLFDGLQQELRRMSGLVRDVLLLARLDVIKRASLTSRIAVDPLLQELALETGQLAPEIALHVDAASDAYIDADPTALREALRNLLDNARKYAPGAAIELGAVRAQHTVTITVRDAGPGMDATDSELAFERYYRGAGAEHVDGSGLGLAIVRAVAQASGGNVELSSTPGSGVVVRLHLPLAQE